MNSARGRGGWAVLAAAVLGLPACTTGPLDEPSLDCTEDGALGVELGEGAESFLALAEGAEPELHHGPQGGTHLLLAARVSTPEALERYGVELFAEEMAGSSDSGEPGYRAVGHIDLWAADGRVRVTSDGGVEIVNLLVIVDRWDVGAARRVRVDVTDECDRWGGTARVFEPRTE